MGIYAGFDMVPRLTRSAVDQQNWQSFIDSVKERYKNDGQFEVKANHVVFKAGEQPQLPFEGHKFLRFSAKISGSHQENVEEYLDEVGRMAQKAFGSRICLWSELCDSDAFYAWAEVIESLESYEQVCPPLAVS